MSILLEIAKALSRIDNKVDLLYSELGPLANQIGKDARAVQFDKTLLYELERSCNHSFRTLKAETGIAVADRRSKQLLAQGDTHPTVVAMQEARDLLPLVGDKNKIDSSRRRFIDQDEQGALKSGVDRIIKNVTGSEIAQVKAMLQTAIRQSDNLTALRIELEASIAQQVDKFLRKSFDDLEGEEIQKMKSLADRVKQIEASVQKQQEKIESHQKAIEERINSAQDDFKGYEKRMARILQKANDDLAETYADMDKKFDELAKNREADKMDMLKALRDKQKKFIEQTYKEIQNESAKITEEIDGAVDALKDKHRELQSLAEQTKDSIIEIDKTVARVGNSIPKPRSRIRNGH